MRLEQVALLTLLTTSSCAHRSKRCTASDDCWPSPKEWSHFNASIGGRLLASRPSAAVCHHPEYNELLCASAKANWTSSDWRTAQPGAYSAILWELGPDQCYINSTAEEPCEQGLVAEYTVNASSVEDVRKAVKWAKKKNLYLTVKNTGHDHLGRSSGKGSFAIWTHHLKGRDWHDDFRPKGAPRHARGTKAVTLKAGEQWLDVYRDADRQGRTVVGGSARTVGAAGGWFTGGGHSSWSHFYGLGVDSKSKISLYRVLNYGDFSV
jgi:FAD/FMN-containing dehydrogenase